MSLIHFPSAKWIYRSGGVLRGANDLACQSRSESASSAGNDGWPERATEEEKGVWAAENCSNESKEWNEKEERAKAWLRM